MVALVLVMTSVLALLTMKANTVRDLLVCLIDCHKAILCFDVDGDCVSYL